MSPSKTLLTVVGARPQFIKSAALTRAIAESDWSEWLVHAGQHCDDEMGSSFLAELDVAAPHARLNPDQSGRTARLADMMRGIADQIQSVSPKAVLVYGDTDATLAGALAAHHAGVPLIHVEAGLRSGDRRMPEEHNRILTDSLSDLLCTTGPIPTAQLKKEGVPDERVMEVGDVMLDVALAVQAGLAARRPKGWPETEAPVLTVTLHRPSNVDDATKLKAALDALQRWSERTGGWIYFPVHPRTQARMEAAGLALHDRAVNPGPIGYMDMQAALFHAERVLTDSGGLQKEAWFQGTSAVVLRDTTEWRELLDMGASVLFDPQRLLEGDGAGQLVTELTTERSAPSVIGSGMFGEGHAATRILEGIRSRFD